MNTFHCFGSGLTFWPSEESRRRMKVRKELREIVYRTCAKYSPDGKASKLVAMREVEIATCPHCGKDLRVRRHMFSVSYSMLPRHKAGVAADSSQTAED